MRAIPYTQAFFLPNEEWAKYEYSDRIMISHSLYDVHQLGTSPILLSITNPIGISVQGVVFSLHSIHDVIFMPSWMIHSLGVTDNLTIACVKRIPCTKIVVRPYNKKLLTLADWNDKFSAAIKYYNTMTIGSQIPILMDDMFMYVKIESLNDGKHHTYYLDNGMEIDLEILEAIETRAVEPQPVETLPVERQLSQVAPPPQQACPYLYSGPVQTLTCSSSYQPFTGYAERLGGSTPVAYASNSEVCYAAAMRRLEKVKSSVDPISE